MVENNSLHLFYCIFIYIVLLFKIDESIGCIVDVDNEHMQKGSSNEHWCSAGHWSFDA